MCLSFFLIFTFLSNLYCAIRPISYETIDRLIYKSPLESSITAWRQVKEYDFHWVSPQYITGWQRIINSSFNAGIYISIFPARTPFEPQEYKNLMYYALSQKYHVSLISQKLITISGYSAESFVIASTNSGNGLGFEVGNIPTTIEYVIIQLEGEPPDSYYHPAVVIIFSVPSKFYNEIYPEFKKFIADFHIKPLPGYEPPPDTDKPPVVTNGSPSGTIIYNKPTISVTTNKEAICKFDFNNKSYEEMDYTLSGNGKIHRFTFQEMLPDGQYTIFVKAKDISGNISSDSYSWNITIKEKIEEDKIKKENILALGFQRTITGVYGLTTSFIATDWHPYLFIGGKYRNSDSLNSKFDFGCGVNVPIISDVTSNSSVYTGFLFGINLEDTKKPKWFVEIPLKLKWEIIHNKAFIWISGGFGLIIHNEEGKHKLNIMFPFNGSQFPIGFTIEF